MEFPEELKEVRKRYPTQWSKEERAQAEDWVESNTEALDLVEKGTQKPYYWIEYEHQNERMPPLTKGLDKMRDCTFALCMRATLRTSEGRYNQGFSDIETCYRLGQHIAANKEAICDLAGYNCRGWAIRTMRMILAYEQMDGPLLNQLQKHFEEFAQNDICEFDLTAERLFVMDVIQCIFTDDGGTPSKWGEGEKGGDQVFWPVHESNEAPEFSNEGQEL
ncbi:MAG: hypothetical protein WBC05_23375 [Sedimentisphaerales bacterium]